MYQDLKHTCIAIVPLIILLFGDVFFFAVAVMVYLHSLSMIIHVSGTCTSFNDPKNNNLSTILPMP